MKNLLCKCCLTVNLIVSGGYAIASPTVIAGSELTAPPPFSESSFWGITSNIERAFSFSVTSGGPFLITELQIAVFQYEGATGSDATFSIQQDSEGEPGMGIIDFEIHDISTTAQVHSLAPLQAVSLEQDMLYWLVGRIPGGQVNWNLGNSAFGQIAYRVGSADWIVEEGRNVSAFAILGTPIPEPTSMILIGMAALGVIRFRKRSAVRVH